MEGQTSHASHDPVIASAAVKHRAASPLRRLHVLEDVPGKRLRMGSPEDDEPGCRPRRATTEPRAHGSGRSAGGVAVPSGAACNVLFDAGGVEVILEPVARRRPTTVRVPAAAITRVCLRATSELGCGLDLELCVDTDVPDTGAHAVQARFRVAGLELDREALDLGLRMGRAVGLDSYVVSKDGLEVVLARGAAPVAPETAGDSGQLAALDSVPEAVDWMDTTRRLRRVSEQTQKFHTTCASGRPYTVQQWEPGWLVHLADAWSSSHAPASRLSRRTAVASLVGLALVIGVLGLSWAQLAPAPAPQGNPLGATPSPLLAWVLLVLAGAGAGGWWLMERKRRALHPRHELVFDWAAATLLFRHEERVVREVGFDEITGVQATLYRGSTRRVSLQLPDRVIVLAEWKQADKHNTRAARSMAVELARALDVPLRTDA